jgi:hypothetical protein
MSSGPGCRSCGRSFPGAHVYELCAACVGKRLAERWVCDVVEELLPAGHYEQGGREYRAGSTAGEPGRSLVIQIGGPKSGLWYDHSAGEGGDLIDLIAACLGSDIGKAVRWARQRLGQPERPKAQPLRPPRRLPVHAPYDEAETGKIAERIFWREAVPLCRGDMVCRYLAGRAIDLERLARTNDGKLPPSLRFHPRLPNREAGRAYPAMVAAIVGREGEFLAVHRTWLVEGENGCVTKAPVEEPKMTLGRYRLAGGAGCIRLWRQKWREASAEDWLALSEGCEDALTIAQAHPSWRVAAGVSLPALMTTWVPPEISRVVLVVQNDKPGSRPALLLDQVRERFRREGRELWLHKPPREVKDVNEVAMRLSRQ